MNLGNIEAICEVVYYKKSKLQRPRLVVAAATKVQHLGKKDKFGNFFIFVRTYHLPCKINILLPVAYQIISIFKN